MLLFLSLLLLPSFTETNVQPGEVLFRTEAAFEYVYTDHQGSFDQIPQAISAFMTEFFKQGQKPSGPLMGVYQNYAGDTEPDALKWRIGLPVPPGSSVHPPLNKTQFPLQEVICILRKGPYDTVGDTYTLLFKTIAQNGYMANGPAIERYLSDPATTPAQDIMTEILIPVRKKN